MKYEVTLLTMDGVMQICHLDRWPTKEDAEEFLLPHTPATDVVLGGRLRVQSRPYYVHEWPPYNMVDGTYFWGGRSARVWGVHPGTLAPTLKKNELAREVEGASPGNILGPVLIAVIA